MSRATSRDLERTARPQPKLRRDRMGSIVGPNGPFGSPHGATLLRRSPRIWRRPRHATSRSHNAVPRRTERPSKPRAYPSRAWRHRTTFLCRTSASLVASRTPSIAFWGSGPTENRSRTCPRSRCKHRVCGLGRRRPSWSLDPQAPVAQGPPMDSVRAPVAEGSGPGSTSPLQRGSAVRCGGGTALGQPKRRPFPSGTRRPNSWSPLLPTGMRRSRASPRMPPLSAQQPSAARWSTCTSRRAIETGGRRRGRRCRSSCGSIGSLQVTNPRRASTSRRRRPTRRSSTSADSSASLPEALARRRKEHRVTRGIWTRAEADEVGSPADCAELLHDRCDGYRLPRGDVDRVHQIAVKDGAEGGSSILDVQKSRICIPGVLRASSPRSRARAIEGTSRSGYSSGPYRWKSRPQATCMPSGCQAA